MESRLIYEAGKTYLPKVSWLKQAGAESEWHVINKAGAEEIEKMLNGFFKTGTFYIVLGRDTSFAAELTAAARSIEAQLDKLDLTIWSEDYKQAMQFSKIGVYRSGLVK